MPESQMVYTLESLLERLVRPCPGVVDVYIKHYLHPCGEAAHLIEVVCNEDGCEQSMATIVPREVFQRARAERLIGRAVNSIETYRHTPMAKQRFGQ